MADIVWVTAGLYPPREFGFDDPAALTASLREAIPEADVGHRSPQGAGGFDLLEAGRMLFVTVPWDSVTEAAAGVFIGRLVDWLVSAVRGRRAEDANSIDRSVGRPHYMFPDGASPEEKARGLDETPYQVFIYGPNGRRLAVVTMREGDAEPTVDRSPKQWGDS